MPFTATQDKINKLMTDMAATIRKDVVTSEDRAAFDRMNAEVAVLEEDLAREQRIAKFESESRSHTAPPRPQPGEGNNAQTAEEEKRTKTRSAFKEWLRYGHSGVSPEYRSYLRDGSGVVAGAERRDLGQGAVAGSITGGAQLVPQEFLPELIEAQKAWGQITTVVKNRTTATGAPMKISLINDTGNGLTVLGEATAPSETDPTIPSADILSTDIVTTGVIKVTLAELEDSAFDLDAWIKTAFGKRYFRGLSAMVTNGNSNNVASLISAATLGATTTSGTAIAYGDIAALAAALDPAYEPNAKFSMNSTTRGVLLSITDTLGRPLYVPNPQSGAFDSLLGHPIVINQSMPNIPSTSGTVYPMQYGDFEEGYLLRTVKDGLAIVRLNERYMDTLEVGFIGYARIGGIGTDAGTHPVLNLKMVG